MIRLSHSLCWRLRRTTTAVVILLFLAANWHEPPDAVLVTETTATRMCTLLPAVAQLEYPPLLVHSADAAPYILEYLTQIGARRIWLIDPSHKLPPESTVHLSRWPTDANRPLDVIRRCWTEPRSVILVDDRDPNWVLAAALLATARRDPAICLHDGIDKPTRDWMLTLNKPELVCVGPVPVGPDDFPESNFTRLSTLNEVFTSYEAVLHRPVIDHLVVIGSDPNSDGQESPDLYWLAPAYAVQHQAAVTMLDRSSSIESQIEQLVAERYPALRYVTLWGNTRALPDEEVDDPVAAAGLETKLTEAKVAVPPLSGISRQRPCQFRVGRMTGDSLASLSLLLARNMHRPATRPGTAPTALILANTDSDLPIMETITRTTAQTLDESGWHVSANYGWRTSWYKRFDRLWGADLVLYEGHTANLGKSVQFDYEREPIVSGLYVFQGCKTLRQPEVTALLRNGAVGVVGTTTNTYSASGSALAKVLVDAMVLDGRDAGTSLMIARNFMLALSDLKRRRGHEQGPKIERGGMTFSLWGDPTLRLPPSPTRPVEQHMVGTTVRGNVIELRVPQQFGAAVSVDDYTAEIPIAAKLAGMYEWESEEHTRRQLPPLYFSVVALPNWNNDDGPRVTTPLARNRWSSVWDPRNRWLYLLIQSSTRNEHDRGKTLVFHLGASE